MSTNYRVQFTEVKPGGSHARQADMVRGTLDDVRKHLDAHRVFAADPITITEFAHLDSRGRVVPVSEWDI